MEWTGFLIIGSFAKRGKHDFKKVVGGKPFKKDFQKGNSAAGHGEKFQQKTEGN